MTASDEGGCALRLRMAIGAAIGLAVAFLLITLFQRTMRYLEEQDTGGVPAYSQVAVADLPRLAEYKSPL